MCVCACVRVRVCVMKNGRVKNSACDVACLWRFETCRRSAPFVFGGGRPAGKDGRRDADGARDEPEGETAIARKIRSNSATSSPCGRLLGAGTASDSVRRRAGSGKRNILPHARSRSDDGRGGRERRGTGGSRRPPLTPRLYSIY